MHKTRIYIPSTIDETNTNYQFFICLLSDSQQNYTSQPTWSQPIPNIIYPSPGSYNRQVNLPVPQFVNPPSIFDTGASGSRPVTGTTSSLVNPNIIINPMCLAPPVNNRSLPCRSDPTNNLRKRAGTTENGLDMDACQQHVTRQRSENASSRNGVATESGSQNLASTAGLTQGLAVHTNMCSGANQHWSGLDLRDISSDLDSDDMPIVNCLLENMGHHS
jgi:hypothetical protein